MQPNKNGDRNIEPEWKHGCLRFLDESVIFKRQHGLTFNRRRQTATTEIHLSASLIDQLSSGGNDNFPIPDHGPVVGQCCVKQLYAPPPMLSVPLLPIAMPAVPSMVPDSQSTTP